MKSSSSSSSESYRWRTAKPTSSSSESGPIKMEGQILLRLKKKQPHRARKYYAILTKGYLQLFTNKENPAYRYQIDLSKVNLGKLISSFEAQPDL
ncbi:unnamed protein product [Cylicocyclus nassatus]|uniref:PH domain-containing protein n=1 Tax=Cylicocyclus nassatus TaxID=53992 RepID=A0AA36MEX9_CYLNA|nr:unnamed protein product [Cylicocyclus nassatus]